MSRVPGSAKAASLSAFVGSESTCHHPGITRNMMLRWSSVQLMSIGRVCTCGHTRAPRAHSRSTASMTRSTPSPIDGLWNSGDSVVGMPYVRDRRPSISIRDTVRPGSKNSCTIWSMRPRSESTPHRASSSWCSAKRHGTGLRSSSMST